MLLARDEKIALENAYFAAVKNELRVE